MNSISIAGTVGFVISVRCSSRDDAGWHRFDKESFPLEGIRGQCDAMPAFVGIKSIPIYNNSRKPELTKRGQNGRWFCDCASERRSNRAVCVFGRMLSRKRSQRLSRTDFEQNEFRIFQQLFQTSSEPNCLTHVLRP